MATVLGGCASGPRGSSATADEEGSTVPLEVQEQYVRALDLLDQADYAAARELLDAVILAQPALAGPRINLGIAYAREGQLELAEAAFLGAVEQRPAAAEAWNELGVVYRRLGRFLSAREAYESALEHAPEYAMAHFNLAVLLDLYLRKPEPAIEHYRAYQALAKEPDKQVDTWIVDLERRVEADRRTAGVVDENL